MGDGIKLSKDKRHKSSSSIAGVLIDGTRSERKLDINGPIIEIDDQFAIAESRCNDLQEKIDLVKSLKVKRKLKKRSMTRVAEQASVEENIPYITVHTQPKKKTIRQGARIRHLEVPPNPVRGYLDPATVEQHQMIGQVRGYNQLFKQPHLQNKVSEKKQQYTDVKASTKPRLRRSRADGDAVNMYKNVMQPTNDVPLEVACGDDEDINYSDDNNLYATREPVVVKKKYTDARHEVKGNSPSRRRHVPREVSSPEAAKWSEHVAKEPQQEYWRGGTAPVQRHQRSPGARLQSNSASPQKEERPVVELFTKSRSTNSRDSVLQPVHRQVSPEVHRKKGHEHYDEATGPLDNLESKNDKNSHRHPRRVKYRSRRYEMPTVASQMKQAGVRYYYGNSNHTNIPFVVSKSTAPSHNIGVNIQQVLNGLKIQQPLSGIPLTIAHHMGLGHIPTYGAKSATAQLSLDNREINAIKLGRRLLRLPSYKYISYNRLLTLYREGDGMVPRFLRAISRPHYFYTSMYNLATNRDDMDGATSKGRGGSQEARQSLQEYANLYREYENIERGIREGNCDPEWERRRDELSRELAAREDYIRRVVQDYRPEGEQNIRGSASNAEENYRHSTFKLNGGDQ